ncbi:MFS transporter [Pseudomaricurvus sp. HS19]|uniref:MFS transporter n=1 Tax=Pseudomaricurvus sp. HS19 TaxID=2692626 RepID=UPI00136A39F6|nr:MFS transporter [Pseudomaricurvus sp. HS19]MYM61952.1 MFS transporter [Pseudomaricurvus sp. HS19]
MQAHHTPDSEWRSAWTVVLAATLGSALFAVPTYSIGIMLLPIEQATGWSRAQISSGLTIVAVLSITLSTLMGMVVDRLGFRPVGILAACLLTSAIGLLSLTGGNLWHWWGVWALIGVACSMTPSIWPGAVSSLFQKHRGMALGITLSGSGIGSALVPLLGNALLERYGWRGAYLGLAAFWGLAAIPLILLFFRSAGQGGGKTQTARDDKPLYGPSTREGLCSIAFIKLACASLAISVPGVALIVNLVPIMMSTNISQGTAAAIAGSLGLATITGRVAGGLLLDKMSAKLIAVGTTLATCLLPAALLLFPGITSLTAVAVVIMGLAVGGKLGAMAYLASRHFGTRSFGVLYGSMSAMIGLGAGLGPMLANLVFDQTQSYDAVLWGTLVPLLIGAAILISLGRYPDFSQAPSTAATAPQQA